MRTTPLSTEQLLAIPKEERLQNIVLDSVLVMMQDIKKEELTEEEFEWWWNATRIDDTHKEFVRKNIPIKY